MNIEMLQFTIIFMTHIIVIALLSYQASLTSAWMLISPIFKGIIRYRRVSDSPPQTQTVLVFMKIVFWSLNSSESLKDTFIWMLYMINRYSHWKVKDLTAAFHIFLKYFDFVQTSGISPTNTNSLCFLKSLLETNFQTSSSYSG